MQNCSTHDEEVLRRFRRWQALRTDDGCSPERERAWNLYVDARDHREDGYTQREQDSRREAPSAQITFPFPFGRSH